MPIVPALPASPGLCDAYRGLTQGLPTLTDIAHQIRQAPEGASFTVAGQIYNVNPSLKFFSAGEEVVAVGSKQDSAELSASQSSLVKNLPVEQRNFSTAENSAYVDHRKAVQAAVTQRFSDDPAWSALERRDWLFLPGELGQSFSSARLALADSLVGKIISGEVAGLTSHGNRVVFFAGKVHKVFARGESANAGERPAESWFAEILDAEGTILTVPLNDHVMNRTPVYVHDAPLPVTTLRAQRLAAETAKKALQASAPIYQEVRGGRARTRSPEDYGQALLDSQTARQGFGSRLKIHSDPIALNDGRGAQLSYLSRAQLAELKINDVIWDDQGNFYRVGTDPIPAHLFEHPQYGAAVSGFGLMQILSVP